MHTLYTNAQYSYRICNYYFVYENKQRKVKLNELKAHVFIEKTNNNNSTSSTTIHRMIKFTFALKFNFAME